MDDEARKLRLWMRVVGVLYLIIGLRLLPFINGPMIEAIGLDALYTGGDIEEGSPAFDFVLDWMATFGLAIVPMGALLLVAAREPVRNRLFVWLAIAHEAVAGILDDIWFITRDYTEPGFLYGWIVLHVIVIVTGLRVLRRAPDQVAVDVPVDAVRA